MKQTAKFVFQQKMIKKLIKYFTVMDVIQVFTKFVMESQKKKLIKSLKWINFIVMYVITQSSINLQVPIKKLTVV